MVISDMQPYTNCQALLLPDPGMSRPVDEGVRRPLPGGDPGRAVGVQKRETWLNGAMTVTTAMVVRWENRSGVVASSTMLVAAGPGADLHDLGVDAGVDLDVGPGDSRGSRRDRDRPGACR